MPTIIEKGLSKNKILSELARSPHGKLAEYIPVGREAARHEPEFLAHLIAWNDKNGQVRDSKVALPIVSLLEKIDADLRENALAHLALLDPRNLLRALRFAYEVRPGGHMNALARLVEQYLRFREDGNWDRVAVQHRRTLKELYALVHVKPNPHAEAVLFRGQRPKGSVFEAVALLSTMTPAEAAGTIMERKIPFLVAMGALGAKAKEPDLVMALIERMSPTELVTNAKMLEKLGVKDNPSLRAALEQALDRAKPSKKTTFKATRAAEALGEGAMGDKMRALQERQIKALGGIDGNWLVLGDKSPSMRDSIEVGRHIAATLAKMVKGQVHLVFFDNTPLYVDATGKDYDALMSSTRRVGAGGNGTSIGCGLQYILDKGIEVDGIAIATDGGENQPPVFPQVYEAYAEKFGKRPPVYVYLVDVVPQWREQTALWYSHFKTGLAAVGGHVQEFDLRGQQIDYYSLPNLVQTMRVNRYSLVDEVMATPLLRLADVFEKKGELIHA